MDDENDAPATSELVALAQSGDRDAFEELVAPHRHELEVHCYRMLASVQDAEDITQEIMLAAWQGIGAFAQRASIRTWLYRIATNRCLNHLRDDRRRSAVTDARTSLPAPEPTRLGEVFWLEPYPDLGLHQIAYDVPGPAARYETAEAVSLAFIVSLQLLTPGQRAALILRDVLGFSARETAEMLQVTVDAANGALKRARAVLRGRDDTAIAVPSSARESDLVARFTRAMESRDVRAIVDLLTEDVWLSMPPLPLEYQGPGLVGEFYARVVFRDGRRFRTLPTRANGQPALALYQRDPHTPIARAHSLLVLAVRADGIAAMTRFDPSVFARFALPRTLSFARHE